jgi:radical SAM superfamily enzyme with C-terminal helix-hairpin-helix motif
MAGLVPIGAKLRDLHNAFSVMPGLLPGIHVVTGLAGCRTPTLSAGAPDVIVLDLR